VSSTARAWCSIYAACPSSTPPVCTWAALDERAQRDGFQLTLLAPAAPIDRVIQLCGLDQIVPFAEPADAVDTEPGESSPADRGSEAFGNVA